MNNFNYSNTIQYQFHNLCSSIEIENQFGFGFLNFEHFINIMKLSELYEKAWKTIISPPHPKFRMSDLGSKDRMIEGKQVQRIDFAVTTSRGSIINSFVFHIPNQKQDLVVYLHGNGGSKNQAAQFIKNIPQRKIAVAAFEYAANDQKNKEYLTYGVNECQDLRLVLIQIKKLIKIGNVIIWGRSMGAVCAIYFAHRYSFEVNSLVLDAPFRYLQNVLQTVAQQNSSLPKAIINVFLYFVKKKVEEEVRFSLFSIDYLSIFKKLHKQISILLIYSKYDKVVKSCEVLQFYHQSPTNNKQLYEIYQGHDEDRKDSTISNALKWILRSGGQRDRRYLVQLPTLEEKERDMC